MSVRILEDKDGYKALYNSVTMMAFGPIFYEKDDIEAFLEWIAPIDPRKLTDEQIVSKYCQWQDFLEEEVSDCCGAVPRGDGDNDTSDYGICPDCGEHCDYVSRKESVL